MHQKKLLLVNANFLTMDKRYPRVGTVAISDGKILEVSRNQMGRLRYDGYEVIDCRGRTVLPGFIDAHCHFIAMAEHLLLPNIGPENASSIAEIQQIVKNAANITPPGRWVRAVGYHVHNLRDKRHPNRWDLDKVTTVHPVCLSHTTGYIHVLNSMALSLVKIDSATEVPIGGIIERDLQTGEPNGVLLGLRTYLARFLPQVEEAEMERAVQLASEQASFQGITSIQDASFLNDKSRWDKFAKYRQRGLLKQRVTMMLGLKAFREGEYNRDYTESDYIRLGGVKLIVNEITGEMSPSQEELLDIVLEVTRANRQAVIHAIEEHIIRAVAEALEKTRRIYPGAENRHRIEHCSVCPPALARQLAELKTVIVTQPNFIYYNGERYLKTVPQDQIPHLYPLKTLLGAGLIVAGSSDSPVAPAHPIHGIYSAVSRLTQQGNKLVPGEKLTAVQALEMYTINAAYAAFEEKYKGSITPGKYADLVLLNHDPTRVKPHEIKDLEVEMAIIGGEIFFQKGF